ncbi:glycoside hydrolase family 15 protein [Geomonas agri]|uniref:glycoside hydrolase family 15 protein n=1 Tax=Geomonas agri TaxID=2873702 RepID=UPI001CD4808D|nr:glycoside hydrolase family 15 protein [Geomonas agri]
MPASANYRYLHPKNLKDVFPWEDISAILNNIYSNVMRDDHGIAGISSIPGAIIASPSMPADPETDQNYVYDWVRDSALTVFELVEIAGNPSFSEWKPRLKKVLEHYVDFVAIVQQNSDQVSLGYARWNLDGTPSKNWTVQNDGPALRIVSHLKAISEILDGGYKDKALENVKRDLDYISAKYKDFGFNIWEEVYGDHFFTKKIIRKAFFECENNGVFTSNVSAAVVKEQITELEGMMAKHIEGRDYYKSNIAADSQNQRGNDKNIDVLFALLHGEINRSQDFSITAAKSVTTVAELVRCFMTEYPVNRDDLLLGLGPNMGRYPFDNYDGDMSDGYNIGHPWFISGNALASFFYKMALAAKSDPQVVKRVAKSFHGLYNITIATAEDIIALGDRHIQTTQRHWDHCRMSEQYDRNSGYLKSVKDLTWSYATYLMAYRLRSAL